MTTRGFSCLVVFTLMVLVACESDPDPMPVVQAPAVYKFSRDGESTVSFDGQTTRILMATELINAMEDFEVAELALNEMWANETAAGGDADPFENPALNESTKSVRSKTAASQDYFSSNVTEAIKIKSEFESWISAQVNEVFPNELVLAEPGIAGQIADDVSIRYVNGDGLEYNQAVNKGLIGALMLDQMVNNYLSISVLDAASNRADNDAGTVASGKSYTTMEHKWDEAYGYLFGTSQSESDPLPTLGGDDAFFNKYLQRVDGDEDFTGIAEEVYDAFKLGRAAIVAKNYTVRDQQAAKLRELLSKVVAVRAVYYLQQGKNGIPTSGSDFGAAFHDLSEGFGFVYSLRFTRQPDIDAPYFTASEVDAMIAQLTAGNGFWDITPAVLDAMSKQIADAFDFTVAEAGS